MPRNDELMNELFDKMLDAAAEQAAEETGAEAERPQSAEFSTEHRRKMENMFRRAEKKERRARFAGYSAFAACILLAVFAVGTSSIMSVGAWRARVMNFLFDSDKPSTEVHFTQGESFYANDLVVLEYIPENFAMSEDNTDETDVDIEFKDISGGDGYFYVLVSPADASVHTDTEDAGVEKLKVNGCEGMYSSDKNINILLWSDDNHIYRIGGNIDKDEMMKIAENLVM